MLVYLLPIVRIKDDTIMADLNHLFEELEQAELQQQTEGAFESDLVSPPEDENHEPFPTSQDDNEDEEDLVAGRDPPAIPLALKEAAAAAAARVSLSPTAASLKTNALQLDTLTTTTTTTRLDHADPLYQELHLWWRHEVHLPELLPWKQDVFAAWQDHLADWEAQYEDQAEAQQEHFVGGRSRDQVHAQAQLHTLVQGLHRLDVQRIRFWMGQLLAVRLHKLQRYHTHYAQQLLEQQHSKNDSSWLSPAEASFVQGYQQLWRRYMHRTVTHAMGRQTAWQSLDEDQAMIPRPPLDSQHVWIRVVQPVVLHHETSMEDDDEEDPERGLLDFPTRIEAQSYQPGTTLIVPYRQVRDFFVSQQQPLRDLPIQVCL